MDWIKAHLILSGLAVATPLAMWWAKKYLPDIAKKYADIFLTAMVNPDISDPYIKEQVVTITKAAMRIAGHTMSEKPGQDKMAWCVNYICSKTSLNREDIQIIAQSVYDNIKSELDEHGKELAATNPPVTPAKPA